MEDDGAQIEHRVMNDEMNDEDEEVIGDDDEKEMGEDVKGDEEDYSFENSDE